MGVDIGDTSNYSFRIKDATPDYTLYGDLPSDSPARISTSAKLLTDIQTINDISRGYQKGEFLTMISLRGFMIDDSDFDNLIKALHQWSMDNDLLEIYIKSDGTTTSSNGLAVYVSSGSVTKMSGRVLKWEYEPIFEADKTLWSLTLKRYTS